MLLHLMNNHHPQMPSWRIYLPFTQHLPVWHVLGSCHMYLSPDILSWMQCSLKSAMDCSSSFRATVSKPKAQDASKSFNGVVHHLKLKSEVASMFRCICSCVPAASQAETCWSIFLTAPASETSRTNGITLAEVMGVFLIASNSKTTLLNTPEEIQS